MSGGLAFFIIAMTAISAAAWLVHGWIQAQHAAAAGPDLVEARRQAALFQTENASLKSQLMRLEQRLAVLERTATDTDERTVRDGGTSR